ncbi:MAG: transposase [Brevundimonas sp.]|uniref:transposase n=2 Tax=Alphaproteobacteria TaxID=28211 RepID=UPI004034B046
MARLPRIVVPGCPHHVTARGNRREPIVFEDGDQDIYLDILSEQMLRARVEVWSYCLMSNHVHLILTPQDGAGMARAIGGAHRRWAGFINARARWSGHLFDSRFASVPMDEAHLITAVRYVALNPVRARLVQSAEHWPWSSVRAHLAGQDDGLVRVAPVLERVERFADLIAGDADDPAFAALRAAEGIGRPLANPDFIAGLEGVIGRPVTRRAPGRKKSEAVPHQPALF